MRKIVTSVNMALLAATCLLAGCATAKPSAPMTLKAAFKKDFLVGVAINRSQIYDQDRRGDPIIKAQFNSISPENALKWASVHPEPGKYDFKEADRYVEFGLKHHMVIVGHTLVWHHQTPRWVFEDKQGRPLSGTNAADRALLLKRMRDHILTVVGRYKGKIKIWDVVNEALNDNGTLRKSPWERIIGPDYIAKAFEYAHEADPNAILRYNDYTLEKPAKRKGAIALMKKLLAEHVPVMAIGLQDHDQLNWPTPAEENATIKAFAKLGLKVMITEMDINVLGGRRTAELTKMGHRPNPYRYAKGLPPAVQRELTKQYTALFRVFVKDRKDISLVTFWGVTDGDSWLNAWGYNYPLLFNRAGKPKPAYYSVIKVAVDQSAAAK